MSRRSIFGWALQRCHIRTIKPCESYRAGRGKRCQQAELKSGGDVAIGKRVETETARVSVPVEKERVVIERRTPEGVGTTVTPGTVDFREGEVAHMNVYEETAEIGKQAFVREEVTVRKEIERDTVEATETLRREELEVDVNGKPIVKPSNPRVNKGI